MKKQWKQPALRLGAVSLTAALTAGLLAPSACAAVNPVLDESYYGTLDYYGGLTEGSVVKSYRTNGNQTITDRGTYDEVINLTDRTEPTVGDGTVTFSLGENAPETFYFEGKTSRPFEEMPFRIDVSYRMNGVDTEPQDMAGQTGVGEVILDITPNTGASEYAQNNYVLMAMTVVRDRDILSLEAPGAQVQKVGDMDAVVYMVLPGEERHFTLRIGTEDFSFGGFTFLVEPATLAQLDQIADLREAKEDMEDSYNSITDSINTILNSLDGLDSKLVGTANGLDQLNSGRATLSAGKNRVYDEADKTLASMTDLSQSLVPVVEHLQTGKAALAETTEQFNTLSDTVDGLRPDVKDLKKSLSAVREDLDDLNDVIQNGKQDTKKLSKLLDQLDNDLDDLQDDLSQVESKTGGLSTALKNLQSLSSIEDMTINGMNVAELETYHDTSDKIFSICSALEHRPIDEKDYKEFVKAHKDQVINAAAAAEAQKYGTNGSKEYEAAFSAAHQKYSAMLTDENIDQLAYLYYHWDQVKQMDAFNGMIGQANGSINQVNQMVSAISKPTAALLDSLKTLTGNANDNLLTDSRDVLTTMKSLLDTANGYDSDALHSDLDAILQTTDSLLGRADLLLEQSKALSDTVTKYEPNAQAALDDAVKQVNASVKLLDDLNAFTKTFENLMKAADPDLDQGAEKSLTGLSGSLRQMASGLGATDSVRRANSDVQTLIEDTWNEYTGEKNNLLNMDSQAEMVSLTSPENQSPNSVQLILRTQEIKVDKDQEAAGANQQQKTTFWQRVARMFHDFAAIFTGD
ncbi:MAG: hypothetical protein Q4C76_06345 [Bacillota bacterium]|nr:hypothetical protein [Bacillota bacterium]